MHRSSSVRDSKFEFDVFISESPKWLTQFSVEFNNWSGLSLESLEMNRRLRDRIIKKTPSLIEVRNYLFYRQGVLLLKMEKPWEVGMSFLAIIKSEIQTTHDIDCLFVPLAKSYEVITVCICISQ